MEIVKSFLTFELLISNKISLLLSEKAGWKLSSVGCITNYCTINKIKILYSNNYLKTIKCIIINKEWIYSCFMISLNDIKGLKNNTPIMYTVYRVLL